MIKIQLLNWSVLLSSLILVITSCNKTDPAPIDPCSGKSILLSLNSVPTDGCNNYGSIIATATGSSNFTYKLDSTGVYQSSGTFINLVPGNYKVFVKDVDGCEKSSATVVSLGIKGPLFTQVRNLITAKCQNCHNNNNQNGGQNYEVDCNIVANQIRIKVRAVDEGTMPLGAPSLTTTEKSVIVNWINAGGTLTD